MSKKRKHNASVGAQQQSNKNKRRYTEDDRKLASIYDRLADESNDVRIHAAQDLLRELSPQNSTIKGKDLESALRRLIRGLCSGRKAARFGFFIAFTELLRAVYRDECKYDAEHVPPLEQTLERIEALTKVEASFNGQVRFNLT